jgi:hypothetical protein
MIAISMLIRDSPHFGAGRAGEKQLHDMLVFLAGHPAVVISDPGAPESNWDMTEAEFNELVPVDSDYVRLWLSSQLASATGADFQHQQFTTQALHFAKASYLVAKGMALESRTVTHNAVMHEYEEEEEDNAGEELEGAKLFGAPQEEASENGDAEVAKTALLARRRAFIEALSKIPHCVSDSEDDDDGEDDADWDSGEENDSGNVPQEPFRTMK